MQESTEQNQKSLSVKYFPKGLTVKELKEIVNSWPEVNDEGEPTEVWVGNDHHSSQVTEVWPLNVRNGKGDLLLEMPITSRKQMLATEHKQS